MSKNSFLTGLLAVTACLLMAPAFAQSEFAIEEIIVTASKRPQTLQEVPIAVTVIDAGVMERAQINDILDLQSVVPSLRVTQLQTSGNVNFIIRGFGNGANNLGIEPSVGVFIDGVYRSRTASALADLPNVERVEVLRGPQSTLFGKNASAGVINVVTAAPDMDGFTGSAEVVYGNYNQLIVKGDISGPLSDTFGFSLSASSNERDGYFTNLASGSDINERSRWGVRGQLLWLPTDSLSFRLIADTEEIDEKCCGVGNLVNGPTGAAITHPLVGGELVAEDIFSREQFYDFDPTNEIENNGVSLQIDWDFANDLLLTSITAFRDHSRTDNADVDFTSARLISENVNDAEVETFTQELRLSQSLDSLDWMLGVYYFDETLDYTSSLFYDDAFRNYADLLTGFGVTGLEQALAPLPPGTFFAAGQGVMEVTSQDDETISIFGQFDWHATDTLTLTLGANYTEVDKKASVSQTNTDFFSSLDFIQIGLGAVFQGLVNAGFDPATALALATAASTVPCLPDGSNAPICNPVSPLQPLQFLPPFVEFPNAVEPGTSNDSKTTWTARVAWDATDSINLYASAGTGFKATSWNLSRDSRPFPEDVQALEDAGLAVNNLEPQTRYAGPEESTVYELGFKGRWDKGYLNVAVFDQEIKGFQSNIFIGTGFTLKNAGKQSTTGVEVDAVWNPTDALDITFSATWLDPLYDSFPPNFPGDVDLTGTTPAGIHEFSMVTSGTWNFDIGSTSGFIRAEYIYEDEIQVVENISIDIASREVSTVNASAGLTFSDRYDLMVWGRNLTDDDYLLSAFPAVAQEGSISGYPNQPRTYGVTLRARFD